MLSRAQFRTVRNTFLLFTCFFTLASCALTKTPVSPSASPLKGTFIQLLSVQQGWGKEDWDKLFGYLQQLGIKQVIVQWSVLDNVQFFSAENSPGSGDAPLNYILKESDKAGIDVIVGLFQDSRYWDEVRKDPQSIKAYLAETATITQKVADRLAPILKNHPSFKGWYIPQEIDDTTWRINDAQSFLFQYLNDLSRHLKNIFPDRLVALSGFGSNDSPLPAVEVFWENLLKSAPIDIMLFQDGIGANKLTFSRLPVYLTLMEKITKSQSRQLKIVVELFEQTTGDVLSHSQFAAKPADLNRIEKQIKIGNSFDPELVAFSIPEYMTPSGGLQAEKLYRGYLSKYQH